MKRIQEKVFTDTTIRERERERWREERYRVAFSFYSRFLETRGNVFEVFNVQYTVVLFICNQGLQHFGKYQIQTSLTLFWCFAASIAFANKQ